MDHHNLSHLFLMVECNEASETDLGLVVPIEHIGLKVFRVCCVSKLSASALVVCSRFLVPQCYVVSLLLSVGVSISVSRGEVIPLDDSE